MAISQQELGYSSRNKGENPSAAVSRSTCLRERGNTMYHEATASTSIASVQSSRLQDAIQLYSQALSLSQSDNDRAMCCKNLGQAFWARAKMTLASRKSESVDSWPSPVWESFAMDILSSSGYFLEALSYSRPSSQRKEWVQGIHWTLVDLAWTIDDMRGAGIRKLKLVADLCSVFQRKVPASVKLQASAILHKAYAQQGLEYAKNGERQEQVLKACLGHLKIAEQQTDLGAASFLAELQNLRDSVLKQMDQSSKLQTQTFQNVVPKFQNIQPPPPPTNRKFEERKGGSFRCPQSQGSNRSTLYRSRSLRSSPPPALPSDKSSESRELEAMFEELTPVEFLTYLYERFPPPASFGGTKISGGDLRSAYKRAISHYHPDHHKAGQQQRILCDEITKYLIINFNSLKTEPIR